MEEKYRALPYSIRIILLRGLEESVETHQLLISTYEELGDERGVLKSKANVAYYQEHLDLVNKSLSL